MSSTLTVYFCLRFGRSGSSTVGIVSATTGVASVTTGATSRVSGISVVAGVTIADDVAPAGGGVSNQTGSEGLVAGVPSDPVIFPRRYLLVFVLLFLVHV